MFRRVRRRQIRSDSLGVSEDEGVIPLVDVGGDEGGSLRVGSSDDEVGNSHDVVLKSNGDKSVDVLRDGDENLRGRSRSSRQFEGTRAAGA